MNPFPAALLLIVPLAVAAPEPLDRLPFHAQPKPLSKETVTEHRSRFLGPRHDLHQVEDHKYQLVDGIAPLRERIIAKLADENGIQVGNGNILVVTAGSNMAFLNALMSTHCAIRLPAQPPPCLATLANHPSRLGPIPRPQRKITPQIPRPARPRRLLTLLFHPATGHPPGRLSNPPRPPPRPHRSHRRSPHPADSMKIA